MERINCDLCGGNSFCFLFKAQDFFSRQHFSLVKCTNCNLVFTNPRPSKDKIHTYYPPKEYYLESRRCLYSFGSNKEKGKRDCHQTRFDVQQIVAEKMFNEKKTNRGLVNELVYFLAQHRLGRLKHLGIVTGKILDIGCGDGSYLEILKDRGWETYGTEISEVACKEARRRGINVFCQDLLDIHFKNNFFDCVRLWSVLEHLYNPTAYLKEIKRILKPKGLLIIQVPNFESLASKFFRYKWSGLDVPRHLYHFDKDTLRRFIEKENFVIRDIHTISVGTISTTLNLDRFTLARYILFTLDIILNYLRLGDSLVCYAQKR